MSDEGSMSAKSFEEWKSAPMTDDEYAMFNAAYLAGQRSADEVVRALQDALRHDAGCGMCADDGCRSCADCANEDARRLADEWLNRGK